MIEQAIQKLQSLGFSEYEARIYLQLIRENPVTAYEASKVSGIPSSKVYGVLSRLQEKGLVQEILSQGKKMYTPLEVEHFIQGTKNKMEETLSSLKEDLQSLQQVPQVTYLWNLQSRSRILEKAQELILASSSTLLLHLWPQEARDLKPSLEQANRRGVLLSIVLFGQEESLPGLVFEHPIEQTIYEEKGARSLILVKDSIQALMGSFGPSPVSEGAWSENRGFVSLAEDYIKHDIYIMKILKEYSQELKGRFGPGYEKLRNVFANGQE